MSRQAPGHSEGHAECLLQLRQKTPASPLLERLAATGFLAAECGLGLQAERIFSCMTTMRPGSTFPLISLALVHARGGLIDQAIAELRKLIVDRPGSEMAKAVLGTMLVHSHQSGALKLFEEIIAANTDQAAVGVARGCIELARTQKAELRSYGSESLEFFRHHNVRP